MVLRGLYIIRIFLACSLLLFTQGNLRADNDELANKKVQIDKNRGTIYELLQQLSKQIDYFFVYDSQLINNDEVVKVDKGEYSLLSAIHAITSNPKLEIKQTGDHILLYVAKQDAASISEIKKHYSIEGSLHDRITQEPIQYSFVSINGTNISTATNQNGQFKLVVPNSMPNIRIKFSHLGYHNEEFQASANTDEHLKFTLEPQYTSLQEVVVRTVNPTHLLQKMMEQRDLNYSSSPVLMTTFYREIVEYKKSMDLTEGVLNIYKTDHHSSLSKNQTKLLKIRRIVNQQEQDSVLVKVKAGIEGALGLDVIKVLYDFLVIDEEQYIPYQYLHTDITSIDGRNIHVVSFEQKPFLTKPLYKGQLFIDAENYALVEARFELNPLYAEDATDTYVYKQPKTHRIALQQLSYIVSYRPNSNGTYYLNQVRGAMLFKVKKKKGFFNSLLKVSFEMITCDIETQNVKPFPKDKRLQVSKVFSETEQPYDENFWADFNTIVPENVLKKFIINNLSEVIETLPDDNE